MGFSRAVIGFLGSCNWEKKRRLSVQWNCIYKLKRNLLICYQELWSLARMDYVTSGWAKAGTLIWRCAKLLAHLRDSMNFLTVVWSFLSTLHSFYSSPSIPVLLSTGFQSLDPILCVPSHFCVRVLPEFLASLANT